MACYPQSIRSSSQVLVSPAGTQLTHDFAPFRPRNGAFFAHAGNEVVNAGFVLTHYLTSV